MTATGFAGLDPCVHCGFCLQSCPTYLVTHDEADSPRGRIVLMRGLARGTLEATDPGLAKHLNRCLGCRACEPVCPSGVQYGTALEAARNLLAVVRPIPTVVRALLAVIAEPRLRRWAFSVARAVRPASHWVAGTGRLRFAWGMLSATRPFRPQRVGDRTDGRQGDSTRTDDRPAVLFRGCVMDDLFGHVHRATDRVLRANGYRLIASEGQACCGALHAHAGDLEGARDLARQNVRAFATLLPDTIIAVNAAGCGAMLKEYGKWLEDDPLAEAAGEVARHVRDVSELLAARGPRHGAPLPLRVAYDPPCHLLHAQGIAMEPEAVLDAIPGLTRVQYDEAEACCGSAGSYSFSEPEMSRAVLARKIAALRRAAPDVVTTGNPGCTMQIGAGLLAAGDPTPVVHPVELLDWSYAAGGTYDD